MRWPWQKPEKRESTAYTDALISYIVNLAGGSLADAGSIAAVEAAAGALSRAFASAEVTGPDWIQGAVNPVVLGQIGRDLIRKGASLHVIQVSRAGRVALLPASSWSFDGNDDPASWRVEATTGGPSGTMTRILPAAGVVYCAWGHEPGQAYRGIGPTQWASTTAKLGAETERSMADEAGGPIANLLAVPQDGGDGGEDDPLADLKSDIGKARGKAVLLETTAAGWGEGMSGAPRKDWIASRLGPSFPASMATIQGQAFTSILAACGCPPGMFESKADGTAQREALRRWHLNLVLPLARLVEYELTAKLETPVMLKFDAYPLDMVSRAQVIDKLVKAGIDKTAALAAVGLDE